MFDIKKAREEAAKLHAEASAHVEKYSNETASEEEQKAQDARIARLEKYAADIAAAEKLATFAFSKAEPVKATVIKAADIKHPDQKAVESYARGNDEPTREEYAQALTAFARGGRDEVPEQYATITTSSNTALVPTNVVKAQTITKLNPFRKAMAALGFSPESYGHTAVVNSPVITPFSGAAFTEGVQATQGADAGGTTAMANIPLTVTGYESKTVWLSNQTIGGLNYDITASFLPALQAARDYGLGKAIAAAIKADASVTQSTTTASTSTVTVANMDSLNQLLNIPYDNNKAIILQQDAYNLVEKLADSTGQPIVQRNDIQGLKFISWKGTPVFKTDALEAMGTVGHVVGLVICMDAFKIRDELEKLVRYVDNPLFVDQTGLDNVAYHAFGYLPAAVGKLVN